MASSLIFAEEQVKLAEEEKVKGLGKTIPSLTKIIAGMSLWMQEKFF